MAQGILINDFRPEYSENLLPIKSLFNEALMVNLTSGLASFAFSDDYNFTSGKSLYCFMESYKTTDIAFNFGSELLTTIKNTGNHIFSFRLLNANTTVEFFPSFVIYVKVWVNGINTNDFECHMVSDPDTYSKKWVTFSQSMTFNDTDEVNFSFYIDADLSYPFNNLGFYIDGLKLEYDDRFLGTPSIYSKPLVSENSTGFESKTDTTNVVSLTAATDNVMSLTATSISNGGLTLLDSNSKIIPIQLNDVLAIEFACTFETPTGTNQSIDILLRVGTSFYRGYNYKLTKGDGNDDHFSVNWNLPCGIDVMSNDVEIVLNPTSTMNYKDRYINVTRIHKAV